MAKLLFTGEEAALSQKAAHYLAERVEQEPRLALGGATGNTPKKMYAAMFATGVPFRDASIYFLDEYVGFVGVGEDGLPRSYRGFANLHLHVSPGRAGVPEEKVFRLGNIHAPRGNFYEGHQLVDSDRLDEILAQNQLYVRWAGDPMDEPDGSLFVPELVVDPSCPHPVLRELDAACRQYDNDVLAAPVAVQILGIGREAHIGFDEKGTRPDSRTHLTRLCQSTLAANEDDYKGGESTRYAVTQGTGTILRAQEQLLLAFGPKKAQAVHDMLMTQPSTRYPASFLQQSPAIRLYIDREALAQCDMEQLEKVGWVIAVV